MNQPLGARPSGPCRVYSGLPLCDVILPVEAGQFRVVAYFENENENLSCMRI